MSTHTVEKIGGTSIANTDVVLNNVFLAEREGGDLYGRMFVVSAYAGVTNTLLEHKKSGEPGVYAHFAGTENEWAWSDALTRVGEAMRAINADVFGDHADRKVADTFVRERIEGVRSCLIDLHRLCSYGHFSLREHLATVREMLSGLGEAHSAHNTAMLLRQHGVNATFIDLTGWRDDNQPSLDERIKAGLAGVDVANELPIITGYAHCAEGLMELYDRGYTEVTFSRVACISGAREAIIHKEFHLSSADPKLVGADKVRKIGLTNYDVADQLSNMGMEAVHPRAAKGLRQAGIPLRVKNTFDHEDPGTIIRADAPTEPPNAEIVTGLKNVTVLEVFEQDMVGVKGYDAGILEALTRHKIRIVTKSSNANTIAHYVVGSPKRIKRAVSEIEHQFGGASVTTRKVAIVSVIGRNLKEPGLLARALASMAEADIEVMGVHQTMRRVDLQVFVPEAAFDDAVRALHAALIERVDLKRRDEFENAKDADIARDLEAA